MSKRNAEPYHKFDEIHHDYYEFGHLTMILLCTVHILSLDATHQCRSIHVGETGRLRPRPDKPD